MIDRLATILTILSLATPLALAADPSAPEGEPEMRTFQVVFVVPNPEFEENDDINDALARHRTDRIGTASNNYLRNLVNDDVAVVGGPLEDSDRIRQVAILDLETAKDAEMVFGHDPGIETGRRSLEIYSWWAPADVLQRPKDPDKRRLVHLGLLYRPDDAPSYPQERLEELEAGHLEHLRRMTELGDLVIAGSVENGADLRGILIFRTKDAQRIQELVAEDPAVQAGRLELDLYRWRVPRESIPFLPKDERRAVAD